MRPLVEFLNHGILPFVGRQQELERLMAFWQATYEAQQLRGMLLVGEAGIGKSRLIEEIEPLIVKGGGIMIHAKVYPESSGSISQLLATVIEGTPAARPLLRRLPDLTMAGVTEAFRQLARLRATLVVIEDIHLLQGRSLEEFGQLLRALQDEPLSLLAATRPVELPARAIMDSCLNDELQITGIDSQHLQNLWTYLFESGGEQRTLNALHDATAGNPLAIRSALRGMISSGLLRQNTGSNNWSVGIPPSGLAGTLRGTINSFSEGLAAHLSREERRWAEQLACLGEVFSREAAMLLLNDSPIALEALRFKGIIRESMVAASSISTKTSYEPLLVFSHTLLHRSLYEKVTVDRARLIAVVASLPPLYSTLPLSLLSRPPGASPLQDIPYAIIRALTTIGRQLLKGSDWRLAESILETAEGIASEADEQWSNEARTIARLRLLMFRAIMMWHSDAANRRTRLDEILALNSSPESVELAEIRLESLGLLMTIVALEDRDRRNVVMDEIEALIEIFPATQRTSGYSRTLFHALNGALMNGVDVPLAHRIERRVEDFVADPTVPDDLREQSWLQIAPLLLRVFQTTEEAERRLVQLQQLEGMAGVDQSVLRRAKMWMLYAIGYLDQARDIATMEFERLMASGRIAGAGLQGTIALYGHGVTGASLTHTTERARRYLAAFIDTVALPSLTTQRRQLAQGIRSISIALGEPLWGRDLIHEVMGGIPADFDIASDVYFALADGSFHDITIPDDVDHQLKALIQSAQRPLSSSEEHEWCDANRRFFALPVHQTRDIEMLAVALTLVDTPLNRPRINGIANDIAEALRKGLQWLARDERRLSPIMKSMLDRFGHHLPESELQEWWNVTEEIQQLRHREQEEQEHLRTGGKPIQVSMLNEISVQHREDAATRVRGTRVCTLIGLLVADRMLATRLTPIEFNRIATGEDDPEHARKILKVALHRAREVLGHEAIPSEDGVPSLQLEIVHVDLLAAFQQLQAARAAVGTGAFARASQLLLRTFSLLGNKTPFPTLYDTFFEAMRDDFESSLRDTTLLLVRNMMGHGDTVGAETVLRAACERMPEDEELAELLQQALQQQDRRADAERIRLRTETAME